MPEDGVAAVGSGAATAAVEPQDGASNGTVAPAVTSTGTTITTTAAAASTTSSSSGPNSGNKPASKPRPKGPKGPNNNLIYADRLPIAIYNPPPLIPHNPISWLHHLYLFCFPPVTSHTRSYVAYFSPLTSSVHVTDMETMMELWQRGFWGKGSLSRSEPEWLLTEMKRQGYKDLPETTSEKTARRRDERQAKKKERGRQQQETIERTRAEERRRREESEETTKKIVVELEDEIKGVSGLDKEKSQAISDLSASGVLTPPPSIASDADKDSEAQQTEEDDEDDAGEALQASIAIAPTPPEDPLLETPPPQPLVKCVRFDETVTTQQLPEDEEAPPPLPVVYNKEHLQLTLQEAFFLQYALGVLEIRHMSSTEAIPTPELLRLFRAYAHFPPQPLTPPDEPLNPDDPFLISYSVYHHFRSLGWTVKSGIKFGVDFLLYARGPVFNHAEFAIVVIPSYERWGGKKSIKDNKTWSWSWLHSVTRVNSQVQKTVVFVYVDVPTAKEVEGWDKKGGIGLKGVLGKYGIKEVAMRRWVPGRNRD